MTINCKGQIIDLSTPKIMGILNITPNSFYDGGKYSLEKNAISKVDNQTIGTTEHGEVFSSAITNKNVFGVQFHPEWDMEISRAYIEARREALGEDVAKLKLASLTETPTAPLILRRFVDFCGKYRGEQNHLLL